jgi:hypothetical protein
MPTQRLFVYSLILTLCSCASVRVLAQQPAGAADILQTLASERATHTAFTFDRDMLQAADGFINAGTAELNSITVENYRYPEPAFYIPENMAALSDAYAQAGWKHLVNEHASPRDSSTPQKPLIDLWLHYSGQQINYVTVLIRAPRQMSVIEVSGSLRPLDLIHLSGHFGIPKVDPDAVMGAAPAPNR